MEPLSTSKHRTDERTETTAVSDEGEDARERAGGAGMHHVVEEGTFE